MQCIHEHLLVFPCHTRFLGVVVVEVVVVLRAEEKVDEGAVAGEDAGEERGVTTGAGERKVVRSKIVLA